MLAKPTIVGICGAPCTGKTTLANWLTKTLTCQGIDCSLLAEPARELAAQGFHIDQAMTEPDYWAFFRAYRQRDQLASFALAIADRTPIDHLSYLNADPACPPGLLAEQQKLALASLDHYKLFFYLPIQFPMSGDGFRTTSCDYQASLDRGIAKFLQLVSVPVISLDGDRDARHSRALEEVHLRLPGLFLASSLSDSTF